MRRPPFRICADEKKKESAVELDNRTKSAIELDRKIILTENSACKLNNVHIILDKCVDIPYICIIGCGIHMPSNIYSILV